MGVQTVQRTRSQQSRFLLQCSNTHRHGGNSINNNNNNNNNNNHHHHHHYQVQQRTRQRPTKSPSMMNWPVSIETGGTWNHGAVELVQEIGFRLRNDLYCVGWGVKLYSLTHPGNWQTGHTNHRRTQRIHLSVSAVANNPPRGKCGRLLNTFDSD